MGNRDLVQIASDLYALLDRDPEAAVRQARELPEIHHESGATSDSVRAGLFIDAATSLDDIELVREARSILESLIEADSRRLDLVFSLANALSTECQLVPFENTSWFLVTLDGRRKARAAYQRVIDSRIEGEIRARSHANLGNELWRAHRWVEAYDAYLDALRADSTNYVAATGAAKVLIRARDLHIGDPSILEAAAASHLRKVDEGRERMIELAGLAAAEELDRLQRLPLPSSEMPDLSTADDYEKFVASNRLMLAPTIEGLDASLKRWDSLAIERVIESTDCGEGGVPPVFAFFNSAKAEYLTARWLFYLATDENTAIPETGYFHDTLDYAIYGIRPSLAVLAQRAALDALDKIAVLVTEYLGLDEDPKKVGFNSRWYRRTKKNIEGWNAGVENEINADNRGFIALAEISADLSPDGFLGRKKELRNAGTHRAIILHDIGQSPSRDTKYATHTSVSEYHRVVLETLRLARASLLYLVEGLAISAAQRERDCPFLGTLDVQSHHWVRGKDDEQLESD